MKINEIEIDGQLDLFNHLKSMGKRAGKREFTATMVAPEIFPNDSDSFSGDYVENLNVLPQSIDPNLIPFDCIKYNGVIEFLELNTKIRALLLKNDNLWRNRQNLGLFGGSEFSFLYENFSHYNDCFSIFETNLLFDTKEKFHKYLKVLFEYLQLQYQNYEIIYPFSRYRYSGNISPYDLIDGEKKLQTLNLSISWWDSQFSRFYQVNSNNPKLISINSIISNVNFNPVKSFDFLMDRRKVGLFPFVFPDYIAKYTYDNRVDSCNYGRYYIRTRGIHNTSHKFEEDDRFISGLNTIHDPIFQPLVNNNLIYSNNIQATKALPNLIDQLYEMVKNKTIVAVS